MGKKPNGMFSSPVSKVFAGMEVVDGIKSVRKEFKNTDNVYDQKLGVNMGAQKPKTANEELNDILKVAGKMPNPRVAKEALKRGAKSVFTDIDQGTKRHIKGAINAAKAGDKKGAAKAALKAMPGVALNTGIAVGGGVGVTKALDKLDKKKTDENQLAHKIIGTTVGAGLAATMLSGGGITQAAKVVRDSAKDSVLRHPSDQLAKSSPTFKNVRNVGKNVSKSKEVKDAIKGTQMGIQKATADAKRAVQKNTDKVENSAQRIVSSINRNLGNSNPKFNKDIPQTLRELAEQERSNFVNKYMINNRKATVEDALKAWKSSTDRQVHNKASRMAVSTAKRINKRASQELDGIIKLASISSANINDIARKVGKGGAKAGRYITDKMITPALTAMASTAAPVIATTLLSQKMMDNAKRNDGDAKSKNSAPAQTLIIKVDNASATTPEKVASDDTDVIDIGNTLEDVTSSLADITGAEKLKTDKVHVGNGQKKTFRMIPPHGMDGMDGMQP